MLKKLIEELKQEISEMDTDDAIEAINEVKLALSEVSPLKNEPADCILWIKKERVIANDYNPNKVAPPEMRLLYTSIKEDGYTQPIVTFDTKDGNFEVVDGYHRNRVGREYPDIQRRIHGYLPITVLEKPLDERMASTIRHNRARGSHQIRSMSDIVLDLSRGGWDDAEICKKLGMDLDEVIRLKQITGLKDAFQNHQFSKSWEEFEYRNYPDKKKD